MTTKIRFAPIAGLGVVLALALALLATAAPSAESRKDSRGLSQLAGEWRMTSLEVGPEGDRQRVPYSGQIIFTKAGTMAVQAMNPDADAEDTPYTVNGYEAFYGTVAVDKRAGRFTVTVRSSAVRNLIGQRLTRVFEVSRNRLVLTPTDASEGWRVTYERVKPS
jgi:hypothetical protein